MSTSEVIKVCTKWSRGPITRILQIGSNIIIPQSEVANLQSNGLALSLNLYGLERCSDSKKCVCFCNCWIGNLKELDNDLLNIINELNVK